MPERQTVKALSTTAKAEEPARTEEIYVKAAEIFHDKGFDATSMNDLAEAFQLTKAGLYYYIKSKEELLFAIMSFGMDCLERHVLSPARAEPDAEKRLRLILKTHARLLTEGSKAIPILSDEVAGLSAKHRRRILARKRGYFDLVRATLENLKTEGKLRGVDTTVATFSLFGMLLWLPRWYRSRGRLSSSEVIEEFLKMALGGLLVRRAAAKPRRPKVRFSPNGA
jgi:AcrR family transcriptional regulator